MRRNKFHHIVPGQAQRGAVLILIVFLIGLALTALVIKGFNAASMKAQQNVKTVSALSEAKEALIAWSVNHATTPGQIPWPDRNTDTVYEGDSPYDGHSDCATNSIAPQLFLGQMPSRFGTPCLDYPGMGHRFVDAQGNVLWYAVSRNLVRNYQATSNPKINPGIVNDHDYPWLIVRDSKGSVISNRVAVVIIAPGPPLGGQNRNSLAPPANAYLDSVTIGGSTYSNFDDNEDFIMGGATDTFNDRMLYITIDELMYALEKRVLMETKKVLNTYFNGNGHFPFAAGLASGNSNQCIQGNFRGLLPMNAPTSHACTCTAIDTENDISGACACDFSLVSSVEFKRNADFFVVNGAAENAPFGNCSVSPSDATTCTCFGAGGCNTASGETEFVCDACGICQSKVEGIYSFNTAGEFEAETGSCTINPPINPKNVVCDNSADGTFRLAACNGIEQISGLLPSWFQENQWEDYIFYELSSHCSSSGIGCETAMPQLTVGEKEGVRALVVSPGPEITTVPFALSKGVLQTIRPSCDVKDYLDTTENTNQVMLNGSQDYIYQPTQRRTDLYNDQVVIVAP